MRRIESNDTVAVSITLNGETATGLSTSRTLLSDFLRQSIGATGTHVGCEHGICGCCTVLIDGVAARSCLTLAVQADGRKIDTVEGLAPSRDKLNALQRAFNRNHALQCGFCTAGILMSLTDFLSRQPDPSVEDVRDVLSGHICRCTGYDGIIKAVMEAAAELRGQSVQASAS